jgi:hypothetical protein
MTRDEYWRMFHLIRRDITGAIASNCTYLTINNLVVSYNEIALKINRYADFWNLNKYALQTTFFIAFGRIFDQRRDSFSIQELVYKTIEYPGFFSKEVLREFKRETARICGDDPEWLTDYLANAHRPTRQDLEPLRTALAPHEAKFREIYEPIRHTYFAHRGKASDEAIGALFGETLIGDVNEILRFLYTLVYSIQDVASNDTMFDLTNHRAYEEYVENLNRKTESLIRNLP